MEKRLFSLPNILIPIRADCFGVQHLTKDVLNRSADSYAGVIIYAESLVRLPESFSGKSWHGYDFSNRLNILTTNDTDYLYPPKTRSFVLRNGPDWVSIISGSGVESMHLRTMADLVTRFKPHIFITPVDHVALNRSEEWSKKRSQKSLLRTSMYHTLLTDLLKGTSNTTHLAVPHVPSLFEKPITVDSKVYVEISAPLNQISIENAPERSAKMIGLEPDHSISTNLPVAACTDKLRIFRGHASPEEILMRFKDFDLFEAHYPFDLANAGRSFTVHESSTLGVLENVKDELKFQIHDLNDQVYFEDFKSISEGCDCIACHGPDKITRAYIYHLIHTQEMLAQVLLTSHNLHQFSRLFKILSESSSTRRTLFLDSLGQFNI